MARALLFVVNDAAFFLSHRLNIARKARDEGWEVAVATRFDSHVQRIEDEGFVYHSIPISRSGTNLISEVRTVWRIFWLLREVRPDIVHAVTIKPVIYAGLVAPFAGVSGLVQAVSGLGHVFSTGGFGARVRRMFVKLAYRIAFRHRCSKVIFQNPDDRNALRAALRAEQAALVPGAGVDPDEFVVRPEPDGMALIVFASRMLWPKGAGDFVEAARLLRKRGVHARFALVGEPDPDNPETVPLEQLITWERAGDVEWWGRREDMPDVFAQSAVVCLPTYYGEGIPKVLIEAAASGRPIVTTEWPGCREIVSQGENGIRVPVRDVSALADALEKLIRDRDLRTLMGSSGRDKVLSTYTSAQVVRKTLEVYEELMASCGRSVGSSSRVVDREGV